MGSTLSTRSTDRFVELVAGESRGWVAAATVIVGDRGRAEEIVQEVLLRVIGRWSHIERLDRPGAFVRRAVINESISQARRRTREQDANRRVADRGTASSDPPDPERELWAAVRSLPEDQMRAVVLRHVADASLGEVAEALAVSEAAARTVLYRARQTLRGTLRAQEVTP